jgi:hypothetical protein
MANVPFMVAWYSKYSSDLAGKSIIFVKYYLNKLGD